MQSREGSRVFMPTWETDKAETRLPSEAPELRDRERDIGMGFGVRPISYARCCRTNLAATNYSIALLSSRTPTQPRLAAS